MNFFWNFSFRSSNSKKRIDLKCGSYQLNLEESSEHIFVSIRHFPSSEIVAQHQVLPSYQAPNIVNIRAYKMSPPEKVVEIILMICVENDFEVLNSSYGGENLN